ncbi:two-component system cell cycle response regulator [Desulfobotulus alkaliphilus]|uniref:histidine kinase n=1 Tax=Desulfobotulus alkaliphilus TaxID=622671 RepID=A0A562RT49_9BACT|nr:response regulator [Desulfobotulus alkaliphilus]TWI72249.1 two-component system cell cycle response regulator [Desulfobotulus alkaliphilus]
MSRPLEILVVDDSALIRRLIREELQAAGYRVSEAANGFEALARAAEPPSPDLITLDIDMPGLGGFETFRKLQEDHYRRFFTHVEDARIPIIFVTANDTLSIRQKGFALGAADFITKPFARGDLKAAVEAILKPPQPMEGLSALVVDDSDTARSIVAENLRREGLQVTEAEDGQAACEILSDRLWVMDMVVTDLVMPRMDGIALCQEIRRHESMEDTPVIFLTALADQKELLKIFASGGTDYLVKPFFKEEFLARVNVHLERTLLTRKLRKTIVELQHVHLEKEKQQKLEGALGMAATICHELNQPLQKISGYSELLKTLGIPERKESVYADHILQAVQEMGDLTRKLMTLTQYRTRKYPGGESLLHLDAEDPSG